MILRRRVIRACLLVAGLLAGLNLLRPFVRPAPPPLPPEVHSTVSIPADRSLDTFAVSPDGRWLAYTADAPDVQLHLFLRPVSGGTDQEVVDSLGARNPFFSPDGNWVGYFARGAIWKSATASRGSANKVCDAPTESAGGAWTDDGRIVFAPLGGKGLMAVPAAGGAPQPITALNTRESELAHGWPHALPAGGLVFTVAQRGRDPYLETLSASNERGPRMLPAVGQAQYERTPNGGFLVYSYLGDLHAVSFDTGDMKTRGAPITRATGVQTSSGFDQLGHSGFAVSRTGTLAWLRSSEQDQQSELVRVDRSGAVARMGGPAEVYQTPRIAPDGRKLAVVVRSGLMTREIRVVQLTHPERVLFSLQGGDNQSPAWMPDGRLSFASNREGLQRIYVASANGKRLTPLFTTDVSSPRNPASWVRKPPLLAFYEIDQFRGRDVLIYRVGEAILPVAAAKANERSPWLSPDGRSIAYVSDATGQDEVYVKRLDAQEDARQVSTAGGVEPVWTRDGVVFREGDRVMLGERALFEGRFEKDPGANAAAYAVDPKGTFFVMLKSARRSKELQLTFQPSSTSRGRADSAAGR